MELRHDEHAYDHILNMPHHVSAERPHMANYDRAAQFAPFAALTGFEGRIEETARLTSGRPLLDEDEKHLIDLCLRSVRSRLDEKPLVRIEYFVPDERKSGGMILSHRGNIAAVNEYARAVVFEDGTSISIEDIVGAEPL